VREKRENGWSSSIDLGIWRRLDQKEIGAQKEEEREMVGLGFK